ncbi:MAG: AAA family ATPase [Aphanocapsa lilacina HA4352-LM1]|jgi:hypothetical protein|nr:AAA family ATPase [Aphanocapsa lilacina HA4352-LM1]
MAGYFIPDRFRDRIILHIAKNYAALPKVQTPLILGIHGPKGEGKSFMVDRVLQELQANVIVISSSELESPDAGEPGRLIRLRYREAAELVKVRGRVAAIVLHDIDAGAGFWSATTQYTVNTQLVNATLMAIADNPTNVQLPGSYDPTPLPRIPFVVTGNDFSKLYAPLVRDGRMSKFSWEPTFAEKSEIVEYLFAEDGAALGRYDLERLIQRFGEQPVDFFAAIRSRAYDDMLLRQVKAWGLENVSRNLVNHGGHAPRFEAVRLDLDRCLRWGEQILSDQQAIESRLVEAYTRR